MTRQITKTGLALSSLALAAEPVAAQTFSESVGNPDELTTGLAILLVGFLGILTAATLVLNSPVALLGEAGSVSFFLLSLLGVTNIRIFYIVGTLHALALIATAVFKE